MSNDLYIRDVPKKIRTWIDTERGSQRMTQKEFVHSILRDAYKNSRDNGKDQPVLFKHTVSNAPAKINHVPHRFKFIDLFAGIGGFRIGLEKAGGECVFTSEWDVHAQRAHHMICNL